MTEGRPGGRPPVAWRQVGQALPPPRCAPLFLARFDPFLRGGDEIPPYVARPSAISRAPAGPVRTVILSQGRKNSCARPRIPGPQSLPCQRCCISLCPHAAAAAAGNARLGPARHPDRRVGIHRRRRYRTIGRTQDQPCLDACVQNFGQAVGAVVFEKGGIVFAVFGQGDPCLNAERLDGPCRMACGVRSEWVTPQPAIIQFSAP